MNARDTRLAVHDACLRMVADGLVMGVAVGPALADAELVDRSVAWTPEICHLARTLVGAGSGEHVLDRRVQDAIARNDGVTIAGTEPRS